MASLNLLITTGMSADTMKGLFERSISAKYPTVQAMSDLLEQIITGGQSSPSVVSSILQQMVRASGTFTLTSVIATDAISINGVTFTGVASGAGANQFNIGVSDTATATNLAASINASVTALVAGYVTAAAVGTVVTVTSTFYGLSGNQTTIASADGTIVANGARLAGGAIDATSKTYSF